MRRSVVLLAGVVGFLGSSLVAMADPAAPATTAPAPTVAAAPASDPANDPNEMVCKTMAPTTGTRLGARRICQTRHNWDMQQQQAARELQQNQTLGLQGGIPGN